MTTLGVTRRVALPRIPISGLDGLPLPDGSPAVPTVYGILVRHGVTGEIGVGYAGKTIQRLRARIEQHQVDKSWGDLIVAAFVIEQSADWNDDVLTKREMFHIRAQRPWHNIVGNMDNPNRIKPWDALAQRQVREPGWVPPAKGSTWAQRSAGSSSVLAQRWLDRPTWLRLRWWTRPRRVVAGWSALWLLVAVPVAVFVAAGEVATGWDGLAYGAGVATSLVGVLMPRRRRRRSRSRR